MSLPEVIPLHWMTGQPHPKPSSQQRDVGGGARCGRDHMTPVSSLIGGSGTAHALALPLPVSISTQISLPGQASCSSLTFPPLKQPKSENIVWSDSLLSTEERLKMTGCKGATLWLTGCTFPAPLSHPLSLSHRHPFFRFPCLKGHLCPGSFRSER